MAGKPDQQRRLDLMQALSADILEWFETGESMQRIAIRLSDKLEETISYAMVGKWAQRAENAQLVAAARARAADMKAELVVDSATELTRDVALGIKGRDDIAAARHEAEQQRWIAGVWNRDKYGQQANVAVAVNVGVLHLDSLRQAAAEPVRPPELEAFDVQDVEPVMLPALSLTDLL